MKQVKVAIIGMGRMGQIHHRHLTYIDAVDVIAISDPLAEEEAFQQRWRAFDLYKKPDAVLNRPDIDAVVICSPTDTHAPLVEESIRQGKHIFCEKPLDLSLDITRALLQQAEAAGVTLMLGFNRRFDPDVYDAKQNIENGHVGRIQIIKITNRDPAIPAISFIKSSGGMFMDFSIHDFDMARYLMNKKVTEVFAKGLVFMDAAVGEAGDIDTALITLTFKDGTYAVIDNSRKAVYGYDQRIEIFGDRGMLKIENNLNNHNILYDANGIHQALPLPSFVQRYEKSYLKEMETFVNAIVENKPLSQTAHDVEMATVIAYAAQQSLFEKRPVSLTE